MPAHSPAADGEPPEGVELVPEPGRQDAFLLRVGGTDQSHVDLGDPLRLEFDYVRRMADVIDAVSPPPDRVSVVHVGGAGLTLPRWVAATRPTSPQVVLEPDEELTAFVRASLPLPARSGIKVRARDGRTGLAELAADRADVVVLDAFDGAVVPADLTTVEAVAELVRVLRPSGVLLVNLADRAPFDFTRRVVATVAERLPHVVLSAEPATLKGRRFGNLLLAASASGLPVPRLQRAAAGSPLPYRVLHTEEVGRLYAGGRRLTDSDASTSPAPPSGPTAFG